MTGLTHPAPANSGPQLDNRRVLAAVVDVLLLVPVAVLMATLTGGFGGTSLALTVAWALFYYFALESGGGQTVGKRLLRLRVVRSDGSEAGLREVAVRTALRMVDGLFAYLVGLAVMLATGQRRQRLGDLAAGTVVASADAEQGQATATHEVEAPASPAPDLDFESVEEAAAAEEDEDGVPVVELVEEEPGDEHDPVDVPAAEQPAVEDEPPAVDEAQPPAVAEAQPPAVAEAQPPAVAEDEPPAVEEDEPGWSPEGGEDDPTSVSNGIEIVSAIDLIMADERESAERDHAPEDAGDAPAEHAGEEPDAS